MLNQLTIVTDSLRDTVREPGSTRDENGGFAVDGKYHKRY